MVGCPAALGGQQPVAGRWRADVDRQFHDFDASAEHLAVDLIDHVPRAVAAAVQEHGHARAADPRGGQAGEGAAQQVALVPGVEEDFGFGVECGRIGPDGVLDFGQAAAHRVLQGVEIERGAVEFGCAVRIARAGRDLGFGVQPVLVVRLVRGLLHGFARGRMIALQQERAHAHAFQRGAQERGHAQQGEPFAACGNTRLDVALQQPFRDGGHEGRGAQGVDKPGAASRGLLLLARAGQPFGDGLRRLAFGQRALPGVQVETHLDHELRGLLVERVEQGVFTQQIAKPADSGFIAFVTGDFGQPVQVDGADWAVEQEVAEMVAQVAQHVVGGDGRKLGRQSGLNEPEHDSSAGKPLVFMTHHGERKKTPGQAARGANAGTMPRREDGIAAQGSLKNAMRPG